MANISRRDFLTGAATATAAVGLAACAGPATTLGESGTTATTTGPGVLPAPGDAPFDTVVVLMQENRSFDHLLGWLPGANGKQEGLSFLDAQGQTHATWALAPDWQGCQYQDPFHFWQAMATHYDDGACDGFLKTQPAGDQFPIGFYREGDLPVLSALATHYTTFDNYFCSMLGPTWPNRLYQLCATTDLNATGFFPEPGQPRPVQLQTAIFDRVRQAGLTAAYYNFGEPMTGLFASQRYDDITYPIDQFYRDAAAGKLANVVFVDPDYTAHAELNGTSNDYHPYGSVQQAEAFVGKVHDALAHSPQWDRMVFVLNFDENGGFYDHVPPPAAQDDTVIPGGGPQPDLQRLGFRVPAIAMGPFAPQRIEAGGPYEHCSILRMIEWRWNLEPMTRRDRTANNLAAALDFSAHRAPIDLAPFTPPAAEVCTNPNHLP
jgi:phospholipase C